MTIAVFISPRLTDSTAWFYTNGRNQGDVPCRTRARASNNSSKNWRKCGKGRRQRRSAAADPPVFVAITELEQQVKQRTAELAEANEDLDIFRKFAEASGEGFGMTDLDGRIAYANSTVARLFGEERPENMVGQSIAAYYTEEYLQRRKEEMIPCLLRVGHWHVETTILPRGTEPRTISQSTFLIRDEEGNPLRVGVVIRDVTDRKRAEESLHREYRNLKHLLQSSDHERQLIAYEIHDGLAQQLAGALMQFQTFGHMKDKNPKEAAKAYDAGLTMLQQGHFEARRLIAGVRPPILDESGIVEAVAHLVHELGREKGPRIEYRSRVDSAGSTRSWRMPSTALPRKPSRTPASTARAREFRSGSCNPAIVSASRSATGASVSTPRLFRRTISAWKASANGRDCWAASSASAARRARARASRSSCPWC